MLGYFRFLAGRERTEESDRHLGLTLAFVAGAINAGGFLAVATYTSHMTGILSTLADDAALGLYEPALAAAAAFAAFVAGAGTSGAVINWARLRRLKSEYALPLVLESALLAAAGAGGRALEATGGRVPAGAIYLLCYLMGLQNAIITKASGARIRTTHMTGNATDLGIEVGKLLYRNGPGAREKVLADRKKLSIHLGLIVAFVAGGYCGALGFKAAGAAALFPLAALVFTIAFVPVLDDLRP